MTTTPKTATKTTTAKAKESQAKSLPEVRQCTDPEHWLFGCVAVAAGENRWGVMNPDQGGHWSDDEEVKDWTVVTVR